MVCLCRRSDTPHIEACNTCEPLVAQILCDQIPLTHSRGYPHDTVMTLISGQVHFYMMPKQHFVPKSFRNRFIPVFQRFAPD